MFVSVTKAFTADDRVYRAGEIIRISNEQTLVEKGHARKLSRDEKQTSSANM